jgi:tetratricopeptide (TPR) repeat protein
MWVALALGALAGCGAQERAPDLGPDPCAVARVEAGGPLSAEAAAAAEPVALAHVRIREARRTLDPGFYTLAEQALRCALGTAPDDPEARRWLGHVQLQFHRFADAEATLRPLVAQTDHWRDHMLLSDALMEQGRLVEAAAELDLARVAHPSLETWDRAAHLAWLSGDLDGAIALEEQAVSAGTAADPEPLAWALTRLGELKAQRGQVPNELGLAVRTLPDYPPAHLALGRWLLGAGQPEAAARHLARAGHTVAAARALAEIDPSTDVDAVGDQDPRGYAVWLTATDPERALRLLDDELAARHDAVTWMARALALSRAGLDGTTEARTALATGIADPSVWLQGAEVLGDPSLAAQALRWRGALLPSEIDRAESMIRKEEGGSQEKNRKDRSG